MHVCIKFIIALTKTLLPQYYNSQWITPKAIIRKDLGAQYNNNLDNRLLNVASHISLPKWHGGFEHKPAILYEHSSWHRDEPADSFYRLLLPYDSLLSLYDRPLPARRGWVMKYRRTARRQRAINKSNRCSLQWATGVESASDPHQNTLGQCLAEGKSILT